MKRKIRFWLLISALALILSVVGQPAVLADSGFATYNYLAASSFLCGLAPSACPDVAMADNGDTIALSGAGSLGVHPKTVTGGGTFKHKNPAGVVLASGTWSATDLLSFDAFGAAPPPFAPPLTAGKALMRVHLVVTGGPFAGAQADGILEVGCLLPGAKVPEGAFEGVRLNIQDVINFNKPVSGFTVFINTTP